MGRLVITAPRTESDLRIGRSVWQWLRQKRVPAELTFDGGNVRVGMPFSGKPSLDMALDALTAWNMQAMRKRPLPPLYESGVRYAREPSCRFADGRESICEEWVTAHEVLTRGTGDCDDLGGWLAAELRMHGDKAKALVRQSAVGWHVVVRHEDGEIEDPSAKLGMPTRTDA